MFTYDDCDSLSNEISEWYTYSEEPEFVWNLQAFECEFKKICKNIFQGIIKGENFNSFFLFQR